MTDFIPNDQSRNRTAPVIDLSKAPGHRESWDRPRAVVYCWALCELLFVTSAWQPSSRLRVAVLRLFGADIGKDVVFRSRTRVRFPWKLKIGSRAWIGEGVWIHNQNLVEIGEDAAVSQETFITTGSHAHRKDMALVTRPIKIGDGSWVTSRCIILGGAHIGVSSLIVPGTVVAGRVPDNAVWGSREKAQRIGDRFLDDDPVS